MKPAARAETYLYTPTLPSPDAIRLGLMYPYTYAVSMSSLGYLNLFRQMDQRADVAVRRITTDDLASESIQDLELMGFSFSFELDIIEVMKIFTHFCIPLMASERNNDLPLIFAGGPVPTTNPEPYADFFDFFIIGDGEETLDALIEFSKRYRHIQDRREKLIALAREVAGIYIPSLYDIEYLTTGEVAAIHPAVPDIPMPVQKQTVSDMSEVISASPILTSDTIFSNTFLVEVMRGCAHRCRFCLASYATLPARGPTLERLEQHIEHGLQYTRKIGLLGVLIADHPEFSALCDFLKSKSDIEVTAASLRADTLTPHIGETFKHGGQQTVTIAVESGSEPLRHRINKHLSTEAIYRAAEIVANVGIPAMKLYGMVGLPNETWDDLDQTIALMKGLKKANPKLKLSLGCSTFVPKAATPFQWMPRESTKQLQAKQEYLRKNLVKTCEFRPSSPKWDYVQALFSRGDRRMSRFIVEFAKQGANLGALNRTLKQMHAQGSPVDLPSLDWYALRKRTVDEIFPWDSLFLGVPKDVLYRESGIEKYGDPLLSPV